MVKIVFAILIAVTTSLCRADSVIVVEKAQDGRRIEVKHHGILVEVRSDIVLFLPDDSAQVRLPASDVIFFAFGSTAPRIVEWTDDTGKATLLSAVARGGRLLFADDAGNKIVIPPFKKGSKARLRVYPAFDKTFRLDVPYVQAKPGFIAEAATEMATTFATNPVSQDAVNQAGGLGGKAGMRSDDLEHALDKLHIAFDHDTQQCETATDPDQHLLNVMKLIAELSQQRPVFVGFGEHVESRHNHPSWDCTGFLLLIGVDFTKNEFILYDPAKSFATADNPDASMRMSFDDFYKKRSNKQTVAFTLIFTPPARLKGGNTDASRPAFVK